MAKKRKKTTDARSLLDGFSYTSGQLHCEGVALAEIAESVGTPAYVYSKAAIVNRVRRLQGALANLGETSCGIHFAVKACSNISILRLIGGLGCGADIVSGGELFRAALALIPPERIVFSGVGKSKEELRQAIQAGIGLFNMESLPEARLLNELARQEGRRLRVGLRFNPGVRADTHKHISTGHDKSKFGLTRHEIKIFLAERPALDHLVPVGLSCHIGSQISDPKPFLRAWNELKRLAAELPFPLETLNLGGGLAIDYGQGDGKKLFPLEDYARLIHRVFRKDARKLSIEPGRAILGPAAVLLTGRIRTKCREDRGFIVLDAGMNDLIRPALYDAEHPVFPVREANSKPRGKFAFVGPLCESADAFSERAIRGNLDENGDLFAIGCAGAYGMSMASQYNSRPRPAEVLVDGGSFKIIRRRESYADLVQHEL